MRAPGAADGPVEAGRPIRVVLVEDHEMVAEAIGLALDRIPDIDIVASCRSIATALREIRRLDPDVVLLDRRLPDGDGIAVIADIGQTSSARVLVLTGEANADIAARVARAGGAGLILKSTRLAELVDAVREVAAGEVVFGPGLLGGVLRRLAGRTPLGGRLTARERETLLLMADGKSTRDIGRGLGVADNTARNHVQRVLTKLGAGSKLEAVAIARREGLLD